MPKPQIKQTNKLYITKNILLLQKSISTQCVAIFTRPVRTLHTGSFAQNSFQIDSINSCCTSKNLEFQLKIVKLIYFLTLKPIKGTLVFILEKLKKIARWRHKSEISKKDVKTMISPLLFRL